MGLMSPVAREDGALMGHTAGFAGYPQKGVLMPAPQMSGDVFRVAHARIDRLQDRLPARVQHELGPCLVAISTEIDELLLLRDGAPNVPSAPARTVAARIERLSDQCAVLEGALGAEGMTVAIRRAVAAVVEACADLATWIMEAPSSAAAQVA